MTYECPTCRSNDPNRYIRCHDPLCPDGRDRLEGMQIPRCSRRKPPALWRRLVFPVLMLLFFGWMVALIWTGITHKSPPPPECASDEVLMYGWARDLVCIKGHKTNG